MQSHAGMHDPLVAFCNLSTRLCALKPKLGCLISYAYTMEVQALTVGPCSYQS